jgi:hypothetical protein
MSMETVRTKPLSTCEGMPLTEGINFDLGTGIGVGIGMGIDLSKRLHEPMSAANAGPDSDAGPEDPCFPPEGRKFHAAAGFSPHLLSRLLCHPGTIGIVPESAVGVGLETRLKRVRENTQDRVRGVNRWRRYTWTI